MIPNDTKIIDVMEFLKGCIQRQVHILGGSVLSEFKKLESFSKPEVFHFKPKPFGHFMSIGEFCPQEGASCVKYQSQSEVIKMIS